MTKKILIVEDDADINKALTLRLRAAGFDAITAPDGLVGLCTATREKPDLMILDISMPGGTGFSVVERLRQNPEMADVPFIFLTASKRPEYREEAERIGASAFLKKPYEASELIAKVTEVLGVAAVTPG